MKYKRILIKLLDELIGAAAFMNKEDWTDYAIDRIMELRRDFD